MEILRINWGFSPFHEFRLGFQSLNYHELVTFFLDLKFKTKKFVRNNSLPRSIKKHKQNV
jgi:hypothetical protein